MNPAELLRLARAFGLGAVSVKPGRNDEAQTALRRADALINQVKEGGRHRALHADGAGSTHAIDA